MRLRFNNPFKAEGDWHRGNLHTHTVHSDGKVTTEDHVTAYRKKDYSFLAITDHGKYIDTRKLSRNDFLMIQGLEVSVGTNSSGNFYHVIALGVGEEVPVVEADPYESPQKVIDLINREHGLPIIAHPYWSGHEFEELFELKDYYGIEVYNHVCELLNDRGESMVHWDALLSRNRRPFGIATDDTHNRDLNGMPSDYYGGWINVKSPELTERSIIECIKKGFFYSSSGPEIKDIKIEDNTINVETSQVQKIAFITMPCRGRCFKTRGKPLIHASYSTVPGDRYVRVQITDFQGHRAWSNPIFIFT
jgi:hypothetical protein